MWQVLYSELKDRNFIVVSIAMDANAEAARPWIEKTRPSYPVLVDREHLVAELYNMVNVPQAVWIDERGTVVRPTENAGAFEGFRAMDRATRTMPEEVAATVARAKATYVAAVRDWVERGAASEHALDPIEARSRVPAMTADIAGAHASFRFGQYLRRCGREAEAKPHLDEARRLHPESWNIWRQLADTNALGLAAGDDFWARVEALGDKHYYAPVRMKGMPLDPPPVRRR